MRFPLKGQYGVTVNETESQILAMLNHKTQEERQEGKDFNIHFTHSI